MVIPMLASFGHANSYYLKLDIEVNAVANWPVNHGIDEFCHFRVVVFLLYKLITIMFKDYISIIYT